MLKYVILGDFRSFLFFYRCKIMKFVVEEIFVLNIDVGVEVEVEVNFNIIVLDSIIVFYDYEYVILSF